MMQPAATLVQPKPGENVLTKLYILQVCHLVGLGLICNGSGCSGRMALNHGAVEVPMHALIHINRVLPVLEYGGSAMLRM